MRRLILPLAAALVVLSAGCADRLTSAARSGAQEVGATLPTLPVSYPDRAPVDGTSSAPPSSTPPPVFSPPFPLVAPVISIVNDSGAKPGLVRIEDNLTFTAVFPADARVDVSKVTSFVWDFGDKTTLSGKSALHRYHAAGRYVASVSVQDVYGRTNTSSVALGVSLVGRLTGDIAVGDQGRQQFAYGDQPLFDYRDVALKVPDAATHLSAKLTVDQSACDPVTGTCQPSPAGNNLNFALLDTSGKVLKSITSSAVSKTLAFDAPPPGAYALRVIGDQGAQVMFILVWEVDFS